MRRVPVRELTPGMLLARDVTNERGEMLLAAKLALTDRYISMLRDRGFATVFVDDPDTEDIEIQDIVSERVRANVTANVCRVFDAMERATAPFRDAGPGVVAGEMQSADLARALRDQGAYTSLQQDIAELVDDVLAADAVKGLNTLRTFDSYQFVHALDSTVIAVMLGRRLHFPIEDLHRIASGCLLHDIGMVMVDRAVLNQPARLTPDDQSKVRAHPQLGYEMLRKLRPNEVLANHAAFQHHERQDGTGYPRGLHGNNRVHRGGVDRSAAGRIVLDAEVAAVADIYDALGSDRPYRPALPPDQVVRTMRRLAGGHLNREIVAQLIALLPVYPLGAEVVVMTGRYRHYRGIIARIHRDDPDHPTVRLLANAERLRIPAVELDLRAVDEVIACVPLTGPEAGQG